MNTLLLNIGLLLTQNPAVSNLEKATSLIEKNEYKILLDAAIEKGISLLIKLVVIFVLFFIGRFFINKFGKLITKFFDKTDWEPSLEKFIEKLIIALLYIGLVILIINIVGGKSVSIAALIGAGGLAVGMSVKDNLSNFAGGIILLLMRPFKAGDVIETQGLKGSVEMIGILYTELISFDGRRLYIPNGPLATGNIINYSSEKKRRLEVMIGVEYGSNIKDVKETLFNVVNNHPKIEKSPAPTIILKNLNDSSVDFSIRMYTKNEDYWSVKFELNELIYDSLNEKGIGIPFPQMTVHMSND